MYDHFLPHHRATIEKTIEHFRANPDYRALLIGGSLVKGLARPDSDVDVMVITTDEAYARLEAQHESTFYLPELSTYEGGYVDGKYLNMQFLQDAARRGSEPTRWSFTNVIIAYSNIPDLQTLIDQVARYPIEEQDAKIRSFFGQFFIMTYFINEANKRQNDYLMMHAASDLVLFGSRLILAHNQMLYPFHKWLLTEVERAPEKPANLTELANAVLKNPNPETAKAYYDCVTQFRDWGVTIQDGVNAFAEDCERSWLNGRPAPADW